MAVRRLTPRECERLQAFPDGFIHGGFVGIITGSIWMGGAEMIIHWLTDDAKCRGRISYHTDQAIHIGCKFIWAAIAWSFA